MRIAIVGGGMTGLALAQRLTARGHAVSLFEREPRLGGLATWQDYGAFCWDRFYHVILPTDVELIRFLGDIDLASELRWRRSLTGFYVDRAFHSMSSAADFLRFPPVGLVGKLRLAATILWCARIDDWRRLEKIRSTDWLRRLSGRATYEKIWKPLLLAKLGEHHERVSAVFIWTYVKRMFSARSGAAQREQLGHVAGGYRTVIERLAQVIRGGGGRIHAGTAVQRIEPDEQRGLRLTHDGQTEHFDKIVFTSPVNVLRQVAPALADAVGGERVEYLGVVCMVLVTRRPLTPYYVVNIADARVPFTGLIGMSNITDPEETAGLHVTFLPKYVDSGSPLLQAPDEALREQFMAGLRVMFPALDEFGIEAAHIHRAVKVQPVQVLGYSELVPRVSSRHPDFFVLNTAQFTHNTLNNNEVVRAVDAFLAAHAEELGLASVAARPAATPAMQLEAN